MDKIGNRLFRASGWWSRYSKPPGWFGEDLTSSQHAAVLEVTEAPDTFLAEATIVHGGGPKTITAVLTATESPDQWNLRASGPQEHRGQGPYLGPPMGRRDPIRAWVTATEAPDGLWAVGWTRNTKEYPEPILPRPLELPELAPLVRLPDPPAPMPVRPVVHAALRASEGPDEVLVTATRTDWTLDYDNNAITILELA